MTHPTPRPAEARPSGVASVLALALLLAAGGCGRLPASVKDLERGPYTGKPWIVATPNPVPAGRRLGFTTVTWDTGRGTPGRVFVSVGGKPEKFFSDSPKYHQDAPWIGRGSYEFRLYADDDQTTPLAKVTVTRRAAF
jgi:hypothetical protein